MIAEHTHKKYNPYLSWQFQQEGFRAIFYQLLFYFAYSMTVFTKLYNARTE